MTNWALPKKSAVFLLCVVIYHHFANFGGHQQRITFPYTAFEQLSQSPSLPDVRFSATVFAPDQSIFHPAHVAFRNGFARVARILAFVNPFAFRYLAVFKVTTKEKELSHRGEHLLPSIVICCSKLYICGSGISTLAAVQLQSWRQASKKCDSDDVTVTRR